MDKCHYCGSIKHKSVDCCCKGKWNMGYPHEEKYCRCLCHNKNREWRKQQDFDKLIKPLEKFLKWANYDESNQNVNSIMLGWLDTMSKEYIEKVNKDLDKEWKLGEFDADR